MLTSREGEPNPTVILCNVVRITLVMPKFRDSLNSKYSITCIQRPLKGSNESLFNPLPHNAAF